MGHGYDLHRLEPLSPEGKGRPFVLGGILLRDPTFTRGPVAHSDGDVLLHAVTDALLGALALPDIGQLFPDTAKAHEGQDSADFLLAAKAAVLKAGYRIGNLDCTVILQRPKLSPVKGLIREKISKLLDIPMDWVNLKGKTHEQVDAVGESRAVEAHVVVVLFRDERGQK
ncbi:MAG: 2-C-methyl-D-erythritol 2,4-cyclodiphosphate synthase [Phycisphaerales bacterium]|nr:2-C-methyl-D-erythritol 2,4-cyclodiphosphate synthase [Phycisphaerales bacterium]